MQRFVLGDEGAVEQVGFHPVGQTFDEAVVLALGKNVDFHVVAVEIRDGYRERHVGRVGHDDFLEILIVAQCYGMAFEYFGHCLDVACRVAQCRCVGYMYSRDYAVDGGCDIAAIGADNEERAVACIKADCRAVVGVAARCLGEVDAFRFLAGKNRVGYCREILACAAKQVVALYGLAIDEITGVEHRIDAVNLSEFQNFAP